MVASREPGWTTPPRRPGSIRLPLPIRWHAQNFGSGIMGRRDLHGYAWRVDRRELTPHGPGRQPGQNFHPTWRLRSHRLDKCEVTFPLEWQEGS